MSMGDRASQLLRTANSTACQLTLQQTREITLLLSAHKMVMPTSKFISLPRIHLSLLTVYFSSQVFQKSLTNAWILKRHVTTEKNHMNRKHTNTHIDTPTYMGICGITLALEHYILLLYDYLFDKTYSE